MAHGIEAGAENLRHAPETVGVLNPCLSAATRQDCRARQQMTQRCSGIALPGMGTQGVNALVKRNCRSSDAFE